MARFNLPDVTPNTDINATLFNEMIAGIYEALSLQNTGGLYSVSFQLDFDGFGERYYPIDLTDSSGVATGAKQYVRYYSKEIDVTFAEYASGVKFIEQPHVYCQWITTVPLFVTAGVTHLTTTGCSLYVQRYQPTLTTVQVLVVGKVDTSN